MSVCDPVILTSAAVQMLVSSVISSTIHRVIEPAKYCLWPAFIFSYCQLIQNVQVCWCSLCFSLSEEWYILVRRRTSFSLVFILQLKQHIILLILYIQGLRLYIFRAWVLFPMQPRTKNFLKCIRAATE